MIMNLIEQTEKDRIRIVENKLNLSAVKSRILSLPDFKTVAIHSRRDLDSPATIGLLIEKWFTKKFNWIPISASTTSGDVRVFDEYNTEVKVSLNVDGKKFNYVQIRLDHDIDYYFLPSYNFVTDTGYLFLLSHDEMVDMVLEHGSYAHGTIKDNGAVRDNIKNPHKLFAIRPSFNANGLGNPAWRSLLQYNKFSTEEEIYDRKIWEKRS